MNQKEPVVLTPIRKQYIWGTEDWMLSCLHQGFEDVPLLIKVITAKDALSVQVHPDDELAARYGHRNGKTEMWYVTDCEPGAYLYYGLKHKISQEEFLKRIRNETILEVCRKVPVKKGDVFYIPAGLIHAIGKGITVAEIQQSSDVTYRVYDYERVDENHKKRPLHIEQAAKAAGFLPPLQGHRPMGPRIQKDGYLKTLLVQCPYFTVYRFEIESRMEGMVTNSFQSLLILEGQGELLTGAENRKLTAGECIFLPKEMSRYQISGKLQLLMSEV